MISYEERVAMIKKEMPIVTKLETKLLKLGGDRLAMGHPCLFDNAKDLLDKGKLIEFKSKQLMPMEKAQCHNNSRMLSMLRKGCVHYTGWALSDDGCWRQHSWVLENDTHLIETTTEREIYFGYIDKEI